MLKRKIVFVAVSILFSGSAIWAFNLGRTTAQNVPQGYLSSQTLQPGLIVQLDPKNGSYIKPLTQANQTKMLGVVVTQNNTPLSLSNNSSQQQTYVASYGEYEVLVSTQNGPIKVGDYISVSAIGGVGMATDSSQQIVLGKAVQAFDGRANTVGSATLTNKLGQRQTVALGDVPVQIAIGRNPLYAKSPNGVPHVLASAAQIVTNQPVSALRIYAGLVILGVTLIIAAAVLYVGIRSSITAIGRNPLAKRTIIRGLISVIVTSLIVFIIGLLAVYLLLKL